MSKRETDMEAERARIVRSMKLLVCDLSSLRSRFPERSMGSAEISEAQENLRRALCRLEQL